VPQLQVVEVVEEPEQPVDSEDPEELVRERFNSNTELQL
jgi:hypothetical protein